MNNCFRKLLCVLRFWVSRQMIQKSMSEIVTLRIRNNDIKYKRATSKWLRSSLWCWTWIVTSEFSLQFEKNVWNVRWELESKKNYLSLEWHLVSKFLSLNTQCPLSKMFARLQIVFSFYFARVSFASNSWAYHLNDIPVVNRCIHTDTQTHAQSAILSLSLFQYWFRWIIQLQSQHLYWYHSQPLIPFQCPFQHSFYAVCKEISFCFKFVSFFSFTVAYRNDSSQCILDLMIPNITSELTLHTFLMCTLTFDKFVTIWCLIRHCLLYFDTIVSRREKFFIFIGLFLAYQTIFSLNSHDW